MPEEIAINGKRLDEVRMPLESLSNGVVSWLSYPKSRLKFSLEEGTLIREVYSDDDNLEAVFKYLVKR